MESEEYLECTEELYQENIHFFKPISSGIRFCTKIRSLQEFEQWKSLKREALLPSLCFERTYVVDDEKTMHCMNVCIPQDEMIFMVRDCLLAIKEKASQ